jgi:hypothetical protein
LLGSEMTVLLVVTVWRRPKWLRLKRSNLPFRITVSLTDRKSRLSQASTNATRISDKSG